MMLTARKGHTGMTNALALEDALRDLPQLPTERLLLRRMRLDDAADMFDYASDAEVTKTLTWDTHLSIDDSLAFLRQMIAGYERGEQASWGIEHKADRKFIGTIGFARPREGGYVAEVGYALSRRYWGQGLMTEALRAVIDFGFRHMELRRIDCVCRVDNIGSYRVMEKSGMQFEGALREAKYSKGRLETVRLYAILRSEHGR
jgi:ribosomal-protein-alanine N-acetyltransferase